MTSAEFWNLLLKAIGILGGVGVVAAAIAGFTAKFMADRSIEKHKAALRRETERLKSELGKETETHKLNLKKQEMNYNRQLDAVSEFIALHQSMGPQSSFPGKNWHDVREGILEDFADSESKLKAYRRKFAAVLSVNARNLLSEAILIAEDNKFYGLPGSEVTDEEAEKAADTFVETLKSLEEELLQQVN
ncbi:MAG: hypothetical protein KIT48_20135 [Pseudolabrys sp.]|nr:hypothetical protein [Pseudolabrys sp.]